MKKLKTQGGSVWNMRERERERERERGCCIKYCILEYTIKKSK